MEYASSWGSGTARRASGRSSPPRASFAGSTSRDRSDGSPGVGQAKLNFEQAMADFQTMFPDMDLEVIEETLRANQGAVERTIDQLLAMSSQSPAETVDIRQENKSKIKQQITASRSRATRWNPPLIGPLPDDFLRLISPRSIRMDSYVAPEGPRSTMHVGQVIDPKKSVSTSYGLSAKGKASTKSKPAVSSSSPEVNQTNDDNYHQYLQNEDFLRELQQDEEFMSALQKDAKLRAGRDNSAFHSNIDNAAAISLSASQPSAEDGTDFQSKLKKNMGSLAKQRLNLFAKQFSRGKKKTPKNILNKATPSSYDHLIEDSNSLVSDDDDHLAEGSAHVRLEKKST